MNRGLRFLLLSILLFHRSASAGDLVFESGPGQVHLLELYTSEGCSSCPPAEARFSSFNTDPRLWKEVVPVAFHVDYWDNLGWPDRFASPAYTQRQQSYAREWGGDSVYTPEFVLDGREFGTGDLPAPSGSGGILTVNLNSNRGLTIHYQAASQTPATAWDAHIATLGIGLETNVRAGENGGRLLRHDFVVLSLHAVPLHAGGNSASLTLPSPKDGEQAIAIWVTQADHSSPVQAAGGWTK